MIPFDQQALKLSSMKTSSHNIQTDPRDSVPVNQGQEYCLPHPRRTILSRVYHLISQITISVTSNKHNKVDKHKQMRRFFFSS